MRIKMVLFSLVLLAGVASADDTLWTRQYGGAAGQDDAVKTVLTDASDNVLVVGSTVGVGTGFDMTVIKYSPDGTRLWVAEVAGAGASRDYAEAAALGPDGSIYVTGTTGTFPNYNILTARIGADGSETWRQTYAGPAGKADAPAAIAFDPAGFVVVTGKRTNESNLTDYVTLKYMPTGILFWSRFFSVGGGDAARAVAIGPGGSVYVTGASMSTQNMLDYATIKYTSTGDTAWVVRYNGSGNADDQPVALVVDAAGNAYVTGTSATAPPPAGTNHYATVKYDPDGGQAWATRYTGAGRANDAVAMVLGTAAVYVTGKSGNGAGNNDYATVAYALGTGSQLWAQRFDGPPAKDDVPAGIALTPTGKIVVTGTSINWSDRGDLMTLRYSADSTEEWAARLGFANDDQARGVAVDSRSNMFVVGNSFAGGNYDFQTAKYDSSAVGGAAEPGPVVTVRPALRIAPSPARGWARVEYSPSATGPVVLSLLAVDGRVVLREESDPRTGGSARLDLAGVRPGVYLVRAESAGGAAVGKLLVR